MGKNQRQGESGKGQRLRGEREKAGNQISQAKVRGKRAVSHELNQTKEGKSRGKEDQGEEKR